SDTAAPPAASNPPPPPEQNPAPPPAAGARAPSDADLRESVCLMIESSARANNLPLEFFARVIWQESRFQPGVVGPRTRSGERAQGIAQFMPRTAAERGLLDPFDPVQKLEERVNIVAASPWGVQLSAGFSRDHALANYAMLAKRYAEVLTGRDPS